MQISNSQGKIILSSNDVSTQAALENEIQTSNSEIKSLLSSSLEVFDISQLMLGDSFKGTVSNVINNQVSMIIDGKELLAYLENGSAINIGEELEFEIAGINDNTVKIKPLLTEINPNEFYSKVLSEGKLPENNTTLKMVDEMIKNQLPIDKNSLHSMCKEVMHFPGADIGTLVEMKNNQIPVNENNIIQYNNYKNFQYEIKESLGAISDNMLTKFSDFIGEKQVNQGTLLEIQKEIFEVFRETANNDQSIVNEDNSKVGHIVTADQTAENNLAMNNNLTIGNVLTKEERIDLSNQLEILQFPKEIIEKADNGGIGLSELYGKINEVLQDKTAMPLDEQGIKEWNKLFTSEIFDKINKNVLEEQWFIKPEEFQGKEEIEGLYLKLQNHMNGLEQVLSKFELQNSEIGKEAINVKGNFEFMNQINQMVQYIQIPLKMFQQTAHSDLYVYANRKNLNVKDDSLSAFLHLDMEALGPVDVLIRLEGKAVDTQFFIEDPVSFDLIAKHSKTLSNHIEDKGYQCKINMTKKENKMNLITDFIEQGKTSGEIKRYSFDVRA